jgi:glycosyltransferase involved in cell wall biosynthesis
MSVFFSLEKTLRSYGNMKTKKIVFLYGAPLDLGWGRAQNLCKGFVEMGHKITYIEHPVSIGYFFLGRGIGLRERKEGMDVIKLHGLPVRRFPILSRLNMALIRYQIKRKIGREFLTPDLLWIYEVAEFDLINLFNARKKVLDCPYDRVSRTVEQFGQKRGRVVGAKENLIIENADHIVAESEMIIESVKSRINGKERFRFSVLNNGVDFDYFESFRNRDTPIPDALQKLSRPIIGYIGSITYWMDIELIMSVARLYPEYSFALVGPLQTNISRISSCKNVSYIGPVPYRKVPEYIKAMDICMIPFKPVESATKADTLKVLQYFALGKPVVSTIKPTVKEYERLIWTGQNVEGFSEAIKCALHEDQELSRRRIIIAKNRSWYAICEKALNDIYRD